MTTELLAWLEARRPPPPPELAARVQDAARRALHEPSRQGTSQDASTSSGSELVRVLARAAEEQIRAARARPGRVRRSAFELLVADALATYACEAALESEDPEGALLSVLEVGRR